VTKSFTGCYNGVNMIVTLTPRSEPGYRSLQH